MGLRLSAFAGICAAGLSIVLFVVGILPEGALPDATAVSFFIGLAFALCYAAYVHGFAVIGTSHANRLLMLAAYALIFIVIGNIAVITGVFAVFGDGPLAAALAGAMIVCRSSAELLLGTSLWNTRRVFGTLGWCASVTASFLGCMGFLLGNLDLVRLPFLLCGSWLFIKAVSALPPATEAAAY
jgi:hypothetical protein